MNFAELFRARGFGTWDRTGGVVTSSSGAPCAVGSGVGEGGGFGRLGLSVSDARGGRTNLAELFRTSGVETGFTTMTTAGAGWTVLETCP